MLAIAPMTDTHSLEFLVKIQGDVAGLGTPWRLSGARQRSESSISRTRFKESVCYA